MIQVQIASQVTTGGVDGIRWVLVDEDEAAPASPTAPRVLPVTAAGQASAAPPDAQARPVVPLAVLKLAVLGLCAGLALWFAQASFGPVTAPAFSAAERAPPILRTTPPSPPAATQPLPVEPSLPAEPSPPASAAASLLTAELR